MPEPNKGQPVNREGMLYTSQSNDFIEVQVDRLKLKLKEFEDISQAKGQALGWGGILVSAVAAFYSTASTDIIWKYLWSGVIFLSLWKSIESSNTIWKNRHINIKWMIKTLTERNESD